MQNKVYYTVQGHSRTQMLVPIESPYATSYLVPFQTITDYCLNFGHCVFEFPSEA